MRKLAMVLLAGVLLGGAGCGGGATNPRDGSVDAGDGGIGDGGGGDGGSGACSARPTTLAQGRHEPIAITVDESFVYWVDTRSAYAQVRRVPKDGGEVRELALPDNGAVVDAWEYPGIVTDREVVYWAYDANDIGFEDAYIYSVARTGGPRGELVHLPGGRIEGLVVDGNYLYYTERSGVWSLPLFGGPRRRLAPVSGGHLAQDGDSLYVASRDERSVVRVPKAGGTATALVSSLTALPTALALDGERVYVSDEAGAVLAVPKGGGAIATLVAPSGSGPAGPLLVAGDSIYWGDGRGLMRARKDGSRAEVRDAGRPGALATDGRDLYWTVPFTDQIQRQCL